MSSRSKNGSRSDRRSQQPAPVEGCNLFKIALLGLWWLSALTGLLKAINDFRDSSHRRAAVAAVQQFAEPVGLSCQLRPGPLSSTPADAPAPRLME